MSKVSVSSALHLDISNSQFDGMRSLIPSCELQITVAFYHLPIWAMVGKGGVKKPEDVPT